MTTIIAVFKQYPNCRSPSKIVIFRTFLGYQYEQKKWYSREKPAYIPSLSNDRRTGGILGWNSVFE